VVRCTPTPSAISATVCCRLPFEPTAWYMRRTVAACRAFSLGLRPRARGCVHALAGALDDQLTLELIDRAEDMEDQPPGRRGRVDLLPQDDQADTALAQFVGEREQVLQRPYRAGQPGDDEHVALAQVGQRPVELGTGGVLAGGGVGEDLVAPVGGQVIELAVVVLAAGGHPRVPDLRHHPMPAATSPLRREARACSQVSRSSGVRTISTCGAPAADFSFSSGFCSPCGMMGLPSDPLLCVDAPRR
jgi:hypothetical protein